MITNERQLQTARAKAADFETALAAFEKTSGQGLDPLIAQAQRDALRQQIKELNAEINEYDDLKSGRISAVELDSLGDLPDGLIRARIAAGLTQKDLAERLGLKEQQVQRYEATRYESASFARVVEIAKAIGVKITKRIEFHDVETTVNGVLKRLGAVGFDPAFVRRRLARSGGSDHEGATRLASRAAMLFDWSREEFSSAAAPEPPGLGAAMARFKMPRGRDARSVAAYTAYAHKLAAICARASADQPTAPIPVRWADFRANVLGAYSTFDLTSVVNYAWDCGVVVLPLDDPGAFHGACWRFSGRNVVVLKQRTRFASRWLADLIHELFHAGQHPERGEFEVIELPETSEERRMSAEEQAATRFAGQALLEGRAEELAKLSVDMAKGRMPALKEAVKTVANKRGADLSALANYMAFRLSLQGQNWWGTAANLQDLSVEPLSVVRDVFFQRFRFDRVSAEEFDLLTLALNDGETADGPAS